MRRIADGGDDGAGRNDGTVVQLDGGTGRRCGADTGQDLNAVDAEPAGRVFGEVGRKGWQDPVSIFDQVYANVVWADVRIIFESMSYEFPHLGHGLNPGEPRTHHHESEQLLLHVRFGGYVGGFEAPNDVRAQPVRVGEVLHSERMFAQS